MPPRPSACRGAVQHATFQRTQHVWITDDVLADAFHRFLNVSNASRKRYGSNVPGPLEARRRASKRRIMGLATGSPGVGPDIGVLFGTENPGIQAWKWEAPKRIELPLSHDKPSASVLPQWLSNFRQTTENPSFQQTDPLEIYQGRLVSVRNSSDLESLWSEIGVEPQYKVIFSRMANTHFLDNLGTRGVGYQAYSGFLRNPKLNVPEAHNIKAFVDYMKKKGVTQAGLGELINRVRDSLRLGTMSKSELRPVLDEIPALCAKACHGDAKAANNWQFGAYWAIWRGMTSCKIVPVDRFDNDIIRKIAEKLLVLKDPPAISDPAKLERINATSHTDPALFRLEVYRQLWPTVSSGDAQDFVPHLVCWIRSLVEVNTRDFDRSRSDLSPEVLKSLLNSMDAGKAQQVMTDTTSALLPVSGDMSMEEHPQRLLHFWFLVISQTRHCWVDIFARDASLALRINPIMAIPYLKKYPIVTMCHFWMRHWLPRYVAEDGGHEQWKRSQKRVRRLFEERRGMPNERKSRQVTLLLNIISALQAAHVPFRTALCKVVELAYAILGPHRAQDLYREAVKEGMVERDPRPFAAAIETIAATNPMHALKCFKSSPDVWLALCPKLPLALIQHDSLPRDELFALLQRRPPGASSNAFSALDINLVHIIAYGYANQTERPTRHRFRNVYFCYLYLRDHGAPLSPLFSKALVRAAITAPLENNEWVSTVKLRWVLRLVRGIEGPEVADKLDKLVWQWRGEVIMRARRRTCMGDLATRLLYRDQCSNGSVTSLTPYKEELLTFSKV
ncbi:hypothetical protein MPH_10689 [Macrophomina phaseolina MS6]|uniref:Uncharacterized protein n=1 Tax=Macrophomina phaseolina (strain MS6) TaxID=1126212 RepID=K2QQL0_MACPH|nr:hypothetical protein MPH_10689 [Macrophomina phaseolina MS6]